ncbi:hypothetical protein QBC46DRAFT_404265 [Diplogelasinospora grovesii]|uniref:CRIB domain-containing protein n=1 Tax=Diplogelasinospora grovesii TaxID=303347 RepID=A0AAN6S9F5_9PEZI|nr:hypothetical protein QBC46DRAFT_404265 [Diplogelasinospora grovesii]
MNMWAVSATPVYSFERGKRKAEKKSKSSSSGAPSQSKQIASLIFQNPPPAQAFQHQQDADNFNDLLEPAIDGPPSPESIRALSKQMKRSSVRDKHQSHHTTSSGSSSLRSHASADRPSWENALEGLTLSRKSSLSGRSTSSSMPSRERPESVQIFGKTIFNRRGKLRRESSTQNSSGSSSLYSNDVVSEAVLPLPPTSTPFKDSSIPALPAIFGRRKTVSRVEQVEESQRRFQISEPYNFQHVTHTQRDHLDGMQRTSRVALASEFSQLRSSQVPTNSALKGIRAEDLHFADFSSDSLPLNEEDGFSHNSEPHTRISLSRPPSLLPKHGSPPRRPLRNTQSQEQLRMPPPRPPRSPIEQSFVPTPPVPPPRVSSRVSTRYDGFDPLGIAGFDRPQTSGGFRHAQPFAPGPETCSPPATSHGYVPAADMEVIMEHGGRPRAMSTPDDVNWPLPCPSNPSASFDASLPEVPEEEEVVVHARPSRVSVTSHSSLRGSMSVPMLRPLSVQQEDDGSRRRSSGASDTLGRFDLFAAQRALRAALDEGNDSEPVARESWEDDIDYCYEHAAEADCDYAWDRPSLDMSRDENSTPVEDHSRNVPSCQVSPAMLTPGQFDMPALSPCSQVSSVTIGNEAITPTVLAPPRASNFSLPRGEGSSSKSLLHVRKPSDASSFKECHGFNLSPSLLIPTDYQQQMLASETETIPDSRDLGGFHYDESILAMESPVLFAQPRASASTIGSIDSGRSNGFERHISTTSTSTDFTRLTMSTTSLHDMETYMHTKSESLHRFPSFDSDFTAHSRAESKSTMPTLPESEEVSVTQEQLQFQQREFSTRGSESNLVRYASHEGNSILSSPGKRKDSIHARRQRARTTSLSTPPPPNQYALFPSSVHVSGNRI